MLMMIPCLISDSMEEELHEKEKEFKAHDEVLCVRYLFDRNSSTIGLYHKFLEVFTRSFLWRENGGDFSAAFSQKVESRKLGCVGGAYGTVRWSTHEIPSTFSSLRTNLQSDLKALMIPQSRFLGTGVFESI